MPEQKGNQAPRRMPVRSDWNMAEKDLERYDNLLRVLDKFAIEIELSDLTNIHEYVAVLSQLYRNMRPIVQDQSAWDKKIEDVRLMVILIKKKEHRPTFKDLERLLALHTELLGLRQTIGLGIPFSVKHDEHSRLGASVK